jgi:hypothetical protein
MHPRTSYALHRLAGGGRLSLNVVNSLMIEAASSPGVPRRPTLRGSVAPSGETFEYISVGRDNGTSTTSSGQPYVSSAKVLSRGPARLGSSKTQ